MGQWRLLVSSCRALSKIILWREWKGTDRWKLYMGEDVRVIALCLDKAIIDKGIAKCTKHTT
jgi:hypothetical protein